MYQQLHSRPGPFACTLSRGVSVRGKEGAVRASGRPYFSSLFLRVSEALWVGRRS